MKTWTCSSQISTARSCPHPTNPSMIPGPLSRRYPPLAACSKTIYPTEAISLPAQQALWQTRCQWWIRTCFRVRMMSREGTRSLGFRGSLSEVVVVGSRFAALIGARLMGCCRPGISPVAPIRWRTTTNQKTCRCHPVCRRLLMGRVGRPVGTRWPPQCRIVWVISTNSSSIVSRWRIGSSGRG